MEISIKLDTKQNKKKGNPIVLSIYVSKTDRLYRYSGFYATPETWDFTKEEPKKSHPHYVGIMGYLLETRMKINQLINSREKKSALQIYEYLNGKDDDFYHFWTKRIEELEEIGKKGSADFYRKSLNVFKKYCSSLSFSEIDYNFLNNFKLYKRKTCTNNGINNYIKAIKTIYNEGLKRGIFTPKSFISPFLGIAEPKEPTKDKYLTIQEMQNIIKNNIEKKYYDYFLLMFYLGGIDFIDLANLKKKHIRNGRIKFTRFKGGTNEIIDNKIFPEAESILKKYESLESEYLVPINQFISHKSQRQNFILSFRKYLAKIGITSYFSSKSARYTFINIGKELLINRDVIMKF